ASAIDAFKTRGYSEVSVNDIADAAGMAKGNVYRYFDSKEALLTAAVETLLEDTRRRFEASLASAGGIDGLRDNPEKSALVLGYVLADVLPMLLELGARAAKGHEPSAELARNVLRTLAATAGRPLASEGEDPITAGLQVIVGAFATVMSWAVGPDWPPDHV
ncbi:MAG: TetR/AcrR family transcriptional regulator, partial [Acidimicrobiales bacterium]|nr:TetR/AcrR family transcriptional regulator [Acidimicrobiales bacterium]